MSEGLDEVIFEGPKPFCDSILLHWNYCRSYIIFIKYCSGLPKACCLRSTTNSCNKIVKNKFFILFFLNKNNLFNYLLFSNIFRFMHKITVFLTLPPSLVPSCVLTEHMIFFLGSFWMHTIPFMQRSAASCCRKLHPGASSNIRKKHLLHLERKDAVILSIDSWKRYWI